MDKTKTKIYVGTIFSFLKKKKKKMTFMFIV